MRLQQQLPIDPVTVVTRRRRGRERGVRCLTRRSSGRAPATPAHGAITPGVRPPRAQAALLPPRPDARRAPWCGRRRPHCSNAAAGDNDDDVLLLLLLLLFGITTPASIPSPADVRMTRWCRAAGGRGRGHDGKSPSHARPRSPCCAPAPLETGLRPCGMERARGARMEFRVG